MNIINRFDTYYENLCRLPVRHFCYKIEILDWYEFVTEEITDILINEGSITINRAQGVRRSCSITLANLRQGKIPDQDDKFWYSKKFKLWSGITSGSKTYWFPQGVYLTTSVSVSNDGSLEISGVDKFGMFTSDYGASILEAEHRIKSGTKITTAIRDILRTDIGNGRVCDPVEPVFDIELYNEEVPYDISVSGGQYLGDILTELAMCLGADIYYDADGRLNVHSGTTDTHYSRRGSQWVFEIGDANVISIGVNAELNSTVNVITVTGTDENECHHYYTAENRNPASPVSIDAIGKRAGTTIETNMGYSDQRCKEFAEYWIREKSITTLGINIESVFLPHFDVDKVVTVIDSETKENRRYIITSITMPFGSTGNMTLGATNVVDLLYYNEI